MKIRKFFQFAQRIKISRAGRLVFISVVSVTTAMACGWSFLTDRSIRFNSERTGRGFYRLPPLPVEFDPATGKERSTREIELYFDENPETDEPKEDDVDPDKTWDDAIAAIEESNLATARVSLEMYLEQTQFKPYWYGDDLQDQQQRRNTAFDLLDALGELRDGSKTDAVRNYLKARLEFAANSAEIENLINAAAPERSLADNWEYLRAASLFRSDRKAEALEAFKSHASKFPQSEKNESAMYMIAKLLMEQADERAKECGNEECKIEEWGESIKAFKEMMRKHPSGRFAIDARGWIAHLYQHEGKEAESLAEYYRLLGNTASRQWRLEAKKSLQMIGHEYEDTTLDKLEELIADEPQAALAYAYHRIYNHAIDFSYEGFNDWCCTGEYSRLERDEETQRVKKEQNKGRHELERVAKFTTAMVKRYGGSRVRGDFLLRVAQAQLELQNFKDANTFANKALVAGAHGESRAQALWVKGSTEHQQKKLASAKVTFTQLIKEFPDNKLTEGARRLLAITAEDQDDLEFALDQYIALGYETDVAYFVDVLLPTDRLAKYVDERTATPQHNQFLYALGVRYMRDKRWNDARAAFRQVRTVKGTDAYLEDDRNATWFFPKEPGYGAGDTNIKTSWVVQDLKTIDIFEYYERSVAEAQNDEQKAEAMYQLASHYFEADDLAFYNASAWSGGRVGSLSQLIFSDHERLPNESRIILEHMQGHDPLVSAISIYEKVVEQFPQTKTAKDALYSVAVAHERLSGRNSLWGTAYQRGLFAGPRMVTYTDVKNAYPHYQLPRGTYGWKPVTRTVNDGPGWAPPPKPVPKISREQRAVRKLKGWYNDYSPAIGSKASSLKAKAAGVSDGVLFYIRMHLYLVYAGFIALLCWIHRREIYEGPIVKGSALAYRGFIWASNRWCAKVAGPLSSRLSLLYLGDRDKDADGKIDPTRGDDGDHGGGGAGAASF